MNKIRYIVVSIIIIFLLIPITLSSEKLAKSIINTIEIKNVDELSNAIANQKPNQIWKIKEGILVSRKFENNKEDIIKIKSIFPNCYICNIDGKVIK